MPETPRPPMPDKPISDAARAQQLYRDISMTHPLSRLLQGAELALVCHEEGLDPKKLKNALLKDKTRISEFVFEINQEHVKNNIRVIFEKDLRRGINMVFGGWGQRLMLMKQDELRDIIARGKNIHGKSERAAFAQEISADLDQRETFRRRFWRPKTTP